MDDVVLNKCAAIERCLDRIAEEFTSDFRTNYSRQDALILNLERACQATIDIAMHYARLKKLGLPQKSSDFFVLLEKDGKIDEAMSKSLQNMVGFRNIAVHDYAKINLDIVESIVKNELGMIRKFAEIMLKTS